MDEDIFSDWTRHQYARAIAFWIAHHGTAPEPSVSAMLDVQCLWDSHWRTPPPKGPTSVILDAEGTPVPCPHMSWAYRAFTAAKRQHYDAMHASLFPSADIARLLSRR